MMAQQLLRQNVFKLLTRCHTPEGKRSMETALFSQTRQCAYLQQHVTCMSTWEKDKKAGYRKPVDVSKRKLIKDGVKTLGSEMDMLHKEKKQKFSMDPNVFGMQHEDCEHVWQFHDQKSVENWTVTADSDNNEGFSQAQFIYSKNKTGLFCGHLSRQVPKDGIVKRAGYCNIRSPAKYEIDNPNSFVNMQEKIIKIVDIMLSFKREDVYDWTSYTHLLLRIRGDGRSYMLIIDMDRFFDVYWYDQYHYVLFTRGGPYWQTAKIPFSKFYATSKGRIQDRQSPIQLDKVTKFGISIGDDNEGPFHLEIDSIAVAYDENHEEEFAYEM